MDVSSEGAVLVAAVGVLGTLLSPVVASFVTTQSRQREVEAALLEKREDRDRDERRAAFVELRTCYIALNLAARNYQGALRSMSYAADRAPGTGKDHHNETLAEARRDYRRSYAEAQMIVPDKILEMTRKLNDSFAEAYALTKRVEERSTADGETLNAIRDVLDDATERLRRLRSAMRADLGVSGDGDGRGID